MGLDRDRQTLHQPLLGPGREHVALIGPRRRFLEELDDRIAHAGGVDQGRGEPHQAANARHGHVPGLLEPIVAGGVAFQVQAEHHGPVPALGQVDPPHRHRARRQWRYAGLDRLEPERVGVVVGRLGQVELAENVLGQDIAGVLDVLARQDPGLDRIVGRELVVAHRRVGIAAGLLGAPGELVEPVFAPFDVADDPHRALGERQGRSDRIPGILF